ncbi:rhodanese-related sulfurtransferase [Fluviicoccus keumensis]|uniref:Rhodanese-related sulfurtransferase n=1 Tax=Fluviicoccus keumensis TaxID=1435465 RepID=A0A4Q7ZBV0_9GAMM|nr:rhodanese-like domain-containing protein [Fluviicoccus keumensis]RZU47425.1 rhodanese-related sulfurtransferase [Fluviicoccus keumensis]
MIRELLVTEFDLSRDATIWDVRDAKSYAEGHLKGAVNRPIDGLSAEVLAAVPSGEPVYVLCGGGTKAPRAAALLDGFDAGREVVVLTGGTRKAKAEGLPIETGA